MHAHAGHSHAHTDDSRRLTIALVLLLAFMAAEVVVGILASSLALLADAAHMLTDAGAIALALFAARLARRPPEGGFTFGYRRAEILSAQLNGATLVGLGALIGIEGIRRLVEPPDVEGAAVLIVAVVGIAVNLRGDLRPVRREPAQPQRRGRLPARPERPVRVHRDGRRRRDHPADRTSAARTASPRCSWRR